MTIKKSDLKEMNYAIKNGDTIVNVAKQYPQYDYMEIYWNLSDTSFRGKKTMITNALNRAKSERKVSVRNEEIDYAKKLINELYRQLRANSKKLRDIDKVMRDKE